MEPILPSPNGSPEMAPSRPLGPEISRPDTSEKERANERPASVEGRADATGANTPPPMPVVPLPAAPSAPDGNTATVVASPMGAPATAADEDLIEKEWVERAKKVISETKHDPFAQEQAVSRLQADYLHKRYGKVIKVPKEE